ncbi:putative AraC family transcriptional regulator [Gordonia polyisoprenivorans NBRC 16320 = JCM 10675]|nr:putative AraC family transcriptional regulator [Gordonia polyisoprenivorans NBRC 16320 = JCM 10675]
MSERLIVWTLSACNARFDGVDVLADLLSRAHARGAMFGHWQLTGEWGLEFDEGANPLSIHTVIGGDLTVERDGKPPERVRQGDLIVIRGGRTRFVSTPGAPAMSLTRAQAAGPVPGTSRTFALGPDSHGSCTEILCGAYRFEGGLCTTLLTSLPDLAVVSSAGDRRLGALITLLADEIRATEPGQQTVLDRLIDLLLVATLRALWTRGDTSAPQWYSALADPVAGAALRAMHADPARAWTVADLAAEAKLSRAAFARRFTTVTGVPPLSYLTTWRMTLAKEALASSPASLAAIAGQVGYADEFSFATAFKREVGEAPGRFRARVDAADRA